MEDRGVCGWVWRIGVMLGHAASAPRSPLIFIFSSGGLNQHVHVAVLISCARCPTGGLPQDYACRRSGAHVPERHCWPAHEHGAAATVSCQRV